MPPLQPQPKINLSRLRDIGWSIWDPIGLLSAEQRWSDVDCLTFADEYDHYLIAAASRLRRNESASNVANYLAESAVQTMGLGGPLKVALVSAKKVVAAIQADTELWTYTDQEENILGHADVGSNEMNADVHGRLENAISEVLISLEESDDIVICDSTPELAVGKIIEAIEHLVPTTGLSPTELGGIRSLIYHALAHPSFFDWEMPTLTGFSAKEFETIAKKLPRD